MASWFQKAREQARTQASQQPSGGAPSGSQTVTGGSPSGGGDIWAEIDKFTAGKPPTQETINALYAHLKGLGYDVQQPTHAGGTSR